MMDDRVDFAEDFARAERTPVEELSDDERRELRVRHVRLVEELVVESNNVVRAMQCNPLTPKELAELAITRLRSSLKLLDRVLELEGE